MLCRRTTGLYHIEKIYFASAYYVWRTPGPGAAKTRAFPPGFQMIARQGSPKARVLFDCSGESPCERDGEDCKPIHTCEDKKQCFPTNRCSELEIRIVFPACWDGESLTSTNFMDHVAYGKGEWDTDQGDAYASECPDTHPVRIPEVHFYFRILDYEVSTSLCGRCSGHIWFSWFSPILSLTYFSAADTASLQFTLFPSINRHIFLLWTLLLDTLVCRAVRTRSPTERVQYTRIIFPVGTNRNCKRCWTSAKTMARPLCLICGVKTTCLSGTCPKSSPRTWRIQMAVIAVSWKCSKKYSPVLLSTHARLSLLRWSNLNWQVSLIYRVWELTYPHMQS